MLKKIFTISTLAAMVLIPSLNVYAQKNKQKKKAKQHPTVLQVRTGVEYSFNTKNKELATWAHTTSVHAMLPISKKIKMDGGVSLNNFVNTVGGSYPQKTISIPVSLQYYPLSEIRKVKPYCGIGVVGYVAATATGRQHNNNDIIVQPASPTETKYISIFFTQGMIFEINTHIQVSESIHFVPGSEKRIGIDLGFGYRLP